MPEKGKITIKKVSAAKLSKTSNLKWKVIGFLTIIIFVIYGNSIPNRYAIDDEFVTGNNPVIKKGIKAIPEIFTTRYATNPKQNYEYRPIVKLTFALEYAVFKASPHVSHFFNVLLYLFLCIFVYLILNKLLSGYHAWIPILAVVLFAVHPVHTEVVSSLKNRDEILSMMGGLAALYSFIKLQETRKWYWIPAAIISFLFGYFSKSSTLVFLAVIPLTLYFFTDIKIKNLLMVFGILILVVLFARIFPRTFLSKTEREILYFENPLYFVKGFGVHIGTALVVILFYLRILVFPHPLLFYYGYDMIHITGIANIWAVLSFVIYLALFVIAVLLFKRKHLISFSILYFLITISMYSNIIKPPPGIVAERFLFAPSLGFCLALAVLAFMIFRIDLKNVNLPLKALKDPVILIALIVVPFSIRTIVRNPDWKDFETLYSSDLRYLENSAKANAVYAAFLSDKIYTTNDMAKANESAQASMKYYKQALKVYPDYPTCWNNLGIIHYKVYRNIPEAITCFRQAARWDPSYADPLYNIGVAYESNNLFDSSEYYYRSAIKIKKDFTVAYSNLANLYYKQGLLDKAVRTNERIMKTDTTSDIPYVNIGNYYFLKADTVQAISWWEKAIGKQPGNVKLDNTLANYFQHTGNWQKADYYNKLALKAKK